MCIFLVYTRLLHVHVYYFMYGYHVHMTLVVIPMIKERLGDSKDQVREKTQLLLQQIMQDVVSSPQVGALNIYMYMYALVPF